MFFVGKPIARVLLAHNAKVYITTRSNEKGTIAVEDLKENTRKVDGDVQALTLELGDLHSVKACAENFQR
jgi:retinol dehydrogenase 12